MSSTVQTLQNVQEELDKICFLLDKDKTSQNPKNKTDRARLEKNKKRLETLIELVQKGETPPNLLKLNE